jgi:hypothetical protein
MYENEYHLMRSVVQYQADPGGFLWAWTASKRSKIYPGEAVFLVENHIQAFAQWLEGLNGIELRVLLDTQVNFSHIKFGRSIRKFNMQLAGNEHDITGFLLHWSMIQSSQFVNLSFKRLLRSQHPL